MLVQQKAIMIFERVMNLIYCKCVSNDPCQTCMMDSVSLCSCSRSLSKASTHSHLRDTNSYI